jgi:hypothetical protein
MNRRSLLALAVGSVLSRFYPTGSAELSKRTQPTLNDYLNQQSTEEWIELSGSNQGLNGFYRATRKGLVCFPTAPPKGTVLSWSIELQPSSR